MFLIVFFSAALVAGEFTFASRSFTTSAGSVFSLPPYGFFTSELVDAGAALAEEELELAGGEELELAAVEDLGLVARERELELAATGRELELAAAAAAALLRRW
mmetsp:Transcript_18645/g.31714  ORF Transcript_18645/g.31714 Transcript_18645/m.31714 type:complete len:104 (+) Transcript_18645:313-624(+)